MRTKIETEGQADIPAAGAVNVILPAGGRIEGDFARAAGSEIKALIPFKNKAVLHSIVEALQSTGRVGSIVVIGPEAARVAARDAGATAALPEGASGPENFFRGLDWLAQHSGGQRVLIVATDLPCLSSNAVTRFLDACPPDADICVPVVSQAAMEARFPGLPGEYVPLREGPMTTGCVFLVAPDALHRNRAPIEAIFAARKNQLAMARLLGIGFLIKYALRRLAVQDIEAQCRRILDCSGAAILDSAPELAFDMDTLEEFTYAQNYSARTDGANETSEESERPDYARK